MNEAVQILERLIAEVTSNENEFTEEELQQIYIMFAEATEIILSSRNEEEPLNPTPKLPSAPYPSSNINAFAFDPKTNKLQVKFMGKDTKDTGPVYEYDSVPPYIFDLFRRGAVGPKTSGSNRWHTWKKGVTPSHGAAMAALIKAGGFNYRRL